MQPAGDTMAAAQTPKITVDSVLERGDLDSNGVADSLVREVKRSPAGSEFTMTEGRLAIYLAGVQGPAWARDYDEFGMEQHGHPLPVDGGTLVTVHGSGGDADEFIVIDVHGGKARELLDHEIDYGEGDFTIRRDSGVVTVTATKEVKLGDRVVTPTLSCEPRHLPATVFSFDPTTRTFVVTKSFCLAPTDG